MGGCISNTKKQDEYSVSNRAMKPPTIKNSTLQINQSIISNRFSGISTVQYAEILDGFKKVTTNLKQPQLGRVFETAEWKIVKCPHYQSSTLWGTCNWAGPNDKLNGKGLLFQQTKGEEFLVGGPFRNGEIIKKSQYFRVYRSGAYYIGELNENFQPHGSGKLYLNQKQYHEGAFNMGVPHGEGKKVCNDRTFIGRFKNGELVTGTETTQKGSYQGQFKNNTKHGKGILRMNSGLSYEGEFENNKKNGYGVLKKNDTVQYQGQWRDDRKVK